ncbi:hypothetical protein AMAG_19346 [Allomyces macrogynus ATCC 38327]|uniref:Uncharacterized protein n=1 Tax=Allomyces macrogynus (strain ATCC 38327) TaxID=578462 RepID=A0A0L0SUW2_ALLM3|nr:hypothetical protein AMAG_19346 [Allomyces macrogynus ATCC 38327]|eukprot:KNE66119.1 hypothetical protein AMAG_19346 [Allomyces macrogynus ATCC 38327]
MSCAQFCRFWPPIPRACVPLPTMMLLYLTLLRGASAECTILDAMTAMTDLLGNEILTRIVPFKEYQHKSRDRWGFDSIDVEYGFAIFEQYFDVPLDSRRVPGPGAGKTRTATALADFGVHVIYISLAGPENMNSPAAMIITQIHAAHIVRLTSAPTWAVTQAYYKLLVAQAEQLLAIGKQHLATSPIELGPLLRAFIGGDSIRTSEATFRHFFAQEVVQRSFPASRRPASLAPVPCKHLQYLIVPMPLDLGRSDVFTAVLLWIFARDSALLGDRHVMRASPRSAYSTGLVS